MNQSDLDRRVRKTLVLAFAMRRVQISDVHFELRSLSSKVRLRESATGRLEVSLISRFSSINLREIFHASHATIDEW